MSNPPSLTERQTSHIVRRGERSKGTLDPEPIEYETLALRSVT
ncbi:hypothetical protein RY831_02020 [Noviherbaspirillum sp. CPCC 100848]|uniref:Uncharacterized protein n=1 Tax=Noviherbaspirillum album TaxID=3080276 RepID=A0ABU6J305_9BURK|nr:hypothetical protein [Noviherbaspirillum sp. CPCC 100848]MEC4717915.1 hypothetical protein [Noviherbaspirillum sp. CPCC 100848]